MGRRIYISPHLDDAVLSCGGVIVHQASCGDEVIVVTVCGGSPQESYPSAYIEQLHKRWGTDESAIQVRKEEDKRACALLGASTVHLEIPDAIYRTNDNGDHFYTSDEEIFGEIHPSDVKLIDEMERMLEVECENASSIYAPIGIGNHVDHQLIRRAVDRSGMDHWLYRDFPYAIRAGKIPSTLDVPEGEQIVVHLDRDEISTWAEAVREYRTQLSTFWSDPGLVEGELRNAHDLYGGIPFLFIKVGASLDPSGI
jgi:LmbE family N-acetylglucosaminyl deacetylase